MSNDNFYSEDSIVRAVFQYVKTLIGEDAHKFIQGSWQSAETEDANLSSVIVDGLKYRYIRKCAHVTGLVANNNVLMVKGPGVPLTIIGKLVGDITKAVAQGPIV